jgi:hypothetical protein
LTSKKKLGEIDSILKKLEEHGFPFEVELSQLLRGKGWIVKNQSYYIDKETGKYRTVDIVASKLIESKPSLNIVLIIECKKSKKPWLFYLPQQESLDEFRKLIPLFQQRLLMGMKGDKQTIKVGGSVLGKFLSNHYSDLYITNLATIPFEPFQNGKSDVLEASMQVVKALDYDLEETRKTFSRLSLDLIHVLFPVIAFDGHLYSYTMHEGKPRVQRTNQVLYNFDYADRPFLIHIITKGQLGFFLNSIDQEISNVTKMH